MMIRKQKVDFITTTMMRAIAALGITTTAPIITPAVLAQEIFESEDDGFRLQVPQGWVIEDSNNVSLGGNIENIALLCLENEALPGLAGEHNCQAANLTDSIFIDRWVDLQSLPEFQDQENNITITTNDLVALWIQYLQNDSSDVEIQNSTDVDEFTKIASLTYTFHNEG